jgi:hypothetical protein
MAAPEVAEVLRDHLVHRRGVAPPETLLVEAEGLVAVLLGHLLTGLAQCPLARLT